MDLIFLSQLIHISCVLVHDEVHDVELDLNE